MKTRSRRRAHVPSLRPETSPTLTQPTTCPAFAEDVHSGRIQNLFDFFAAPRSIGADLQLCKASRRIFAELQDFLSRSLAELQDFVEESDFTLVPQSHANRAFRAPKFYLSIRPDGRFSQISLVKTACLRTFSRFGGRGQEHRKRLSDRAQCR